MKLDSDEIREAADALLRDALKELFTNEETKISISDFNTQSDRGIDFVFEIIERSTKITKLKFNAQNKGVEKTENIEPLKTDRSGPQGFISFKLDKLRHVPYYTSEIAEPVIIFLCDLETKKVYWYAIQLDEDIEGRAIINLNKRSSSVQIYFDPNNVLNIENRKRFLDDVNESKVDQNIKYNYKEQSSTYVSDTFSNIIENEDVSNAIFRAVDSFGKLYLVPKYLIAKQYPFSKTKENLGYCNLSTLYTSNKLVYDFFQKLKDKKLTEQEIIILRFLNQNFIYHVNLTNSSRSKQICIHDLFDSESCPCILCRYRKFDYGNTLSILDQKDNTQDEELFRKKIYVQYRLGLYEKTLLDLYNLYNNARRNGDWDLYYLSIYNLKKLKRISWLYDYKDESSTIQKTVDDIILDKDYELARHKVNNDLAEAIRWIHENKFYNNTLYNISVLSRQILNKVHLDQRGGWTTDKKESELILEFAYFISFVELNPVFYDRFSDFDHIIHVVFESIIAPNLISRNDTTKETSIDPFIINRIIRYGNSDKIITTLKNYNISSIEITNEINNNSNSELIIQTIINFASSLPKIKNALTYGDDKMNHHLRDEIRRVIQNSLILFSYFNISKELTQKFTNLCAIKFLGYDSVNWDHKYFDHFIWKKGDIISSRNLEKILSCSNNKNDLLESVNIVQIIKELKRRLFDLKNSSVVQKTLKKVLLLENKDKDLRTLIYLYKYLDEQNRDIIKQKIENRLRDKFRGEIYYRAVIFDIINYKDYFEKFISIVPRSKNESSFKEMMTGKKDPFNIRLNWLIQICYKLDIPIPAEVIAPTPYYEWLFDPVIFDYSKFNPIWLLDFQDEEYIKKFRSIPEIKVELGKYLSKNIHRNLTRFYFNELSN